MRGWVVGAALLAAFAGGFAVAQGVGQSGREPQFDNSEVKVWKSVVMPNAPLPLHRHEHPRVIIALSGGTMKIVESDGKSESHVWETGKAYWLPKNPPAPVMRMLFPAKRSTRGPSVRATSSASFTCCASIDGSSATGECRGYANGQRTMGVTPATERVDST